MKNKLVLVFSVFLLMGTSHLKSEDPYPKKYQGYPQFESFVSTHLDIIEKIIPKEPIIFEAGGHYGHDTLRFIQKWPDATIISFEANPHAFEIFQKTTEGISNIYSYNLAVNNFNGRTSMYICHGSSGNEPIFEGASSLLESSEWMKHNYRGPKIEVSCVVLDDWCKENRVDHIDFMWLDLEGLELQVLESSPDILKTVKVIYTETNFKEFRKHMTQYAPLNAFLKKNDFTLLAHWYAQGFQGNAIYVRNSELQKALK